MITGFTPVYIRTPSPAIDAAVMDLKKAVYDVAKALNAVVAYEARAFSNGNGLYFKDNGGLLALDRDGNGAIDGIGDLFGSPTQDAFAMLRGHDANGDGRISAADPAFASLLVWRDANGDGVELAERMYGNSAVA